MPDTTDTKVIIALLQQDRQQRDERQTKSDARQDKMDASMTHLHDCVHDIGQDVKQAVQEVGVMRGYFIGVSPGEHIRDHLKIVDLSAMVKDLQELKTTLRSAVELTHELEKVTKDVAELKADRQKLAGGWWVIGILGSLLMAAASLYKQFMG